MGASRAHCVDANTQRRRRPDPTQRFSPNPSVRRHVTVSACPQRRNCAADGTPRYRRSRRIQLPSIAQNPDPLSSRPPSPKLGVATASARPSVLWTHAVRQVGRLAKVWTRKIAMHAAPISPALLTIAANQFDVRVDPNPTPSPQVEAYRLPGNSVP